MRVCVGDPGLASLTGLEESFLKFGPGLSAPASARHPSASKRDENDVDLGSSGPVLLPGSALLAGAGKDANLFVIDASNMSILSQTVISTDFDYCLFPMMFGCGWPHVHGTPVAWRDSPSTVRLFVWPEHSRLKAFTITTTPTPGVPAPIDSSAFTAPRHSMPGGLVTLSWDGTRNSTAILWASIPIKDWDDALTKLSPGVLRAFDANNLRTVIWSSEGNSTRDGVGLFAKNAAPVVADGRVYLATFSNLVRVYGMRQWASRVTASDESRVAKVGQSYGPLLTLQNTGNRIWTAADGDALRVTFADQGGGTAVSTTDFPLPKDVGPGELIQMDVKVPAPAAGTYNFEATMITGTAKAPFGERLLKWNVTVT